MLNAVTVDVEEYFHPTEVQAAVDQSRWAALPSRIEHQLDQILELLATRRTKATFFVLGWVAERNPRAIQKIVAAGHEIGCHSHFHQLVYSLTPQEFRRDTRRAVAAIENACGVTPRVYRAPSYSITQESMWALEILVEEGFVSDSSIYPILTTVMEFRVRPAIRTSSKRRPARSANSRSRPYKLSKDRVAPIGGGGYLRLLPYRYTSAGIRRLNREENQPACIYFHPWEIDPDQPRLASGLIARVRTYTGVKGMARKLDRLLTEFQFSTLSHVYGEVGRSAAIIAR